MIFEENVVDQEALILKRADFEAIPITVADALFVTDDTIVKAGTPLASDGTEAETTDTNVEGVYTLQMTTAAIAGDILTIDGVDYTCAATEDVDAKEFAVGSSIADQITSLLNMVTCADFTVAAVSGATDKLGFTQKVAATGIKPTVSVTQTTSGALVVGSVITVTAGVTGEITSDVVGILLHDVVKTDPNGALLKKAYLNTTVAETSYGSSYDAATKAALPMIVFE